MESDSVTERRSNSEYIFFIVVCSKMDHSDISSWPQKRIAEQRIIQATAQPKAGAYKNGD